MRLGLAAGIGIALPGCLRPMLAEESEASAVRGRVALPPVTDRLSRAMNDVLQSRLGRPGPDPTLRLVVDRQLSERGLLVQQDNAVTRINVTAIARFALYRDGVAEPVLEERLVSEAGFDQTASLYASRTTKRDVEDRLMRDLGERIARRVLVRTRSSEATG
ncbi:MAG: LPS assembly lipoprotein LptE [Paracoccaceae bacterium]